MRYPLPFVKLTGTGNDFFVIDNRSGLVPDEAMAELARRACRRRTSVGADGLILIQADTTCDFSWRFFNSDGSEAGMCGNGARCAARFAHLSGIAGADMRFRTLAGVIRASVDGPVVRVGLTRPQGAVPRFFLSLADGSVLDAGFVDTGVPHTVVFFPRGELDGLDVQTLGREIRNHPRFAPKGTNANFGEVTGPRALRIRTYERGVEGETLACGTGAVASAILAVLRGVAKPPIEVTTRGGDSLTVHLDGADPAGGDVTLEGTAHVVYRGELTDETIKGG